MKRLFLKKFFPTSKTTTIQKEICGIRQHSGETLHEYWERFNKLCTTNMVDAASGGALMDKTPTTVRHLISNMASNTQQFGIKGGVGTSRMVNESEHVESALQWSTLLICALLCRKQRQKVQNVLEC
ncbi:hypothetical protein CR513_39810, partial [Mucuna pruriens]